MSYNRRGRKVKTESKISENSNTEPNLLGKNRRCKVMTQADFVTPNIYDRENSCDLYTLAIDVGEINLGYAIYNRNIIKFDLFNSDAAIKSTKFPKHTDLPSKRAKVIIEWFKKLVNSYNIVELVVEQQVNKNITCMCIQNFLIALAAEHNIHFKIYNPKNKFQYIPVEFISKSKEHKKISIHYALNIIHNLGLSIQHFKEYPKKDDISDAICMSVMSRETDTNIIKYLITDHENNPLLSELTKPIKFNKLMMY